MPKGIPDLGINLKKKKKNTTREQDTSAALLRKMKRKAQHDKRKAMRDAQPKQPQVVKQVPELAEIRYEEPTVKLSKFEKMVQRVNQIEDIAKLKKIIYNRNYRLNAKFKKEFPDKAAERNILKFPPTIDIRIVGQATFNRLNKIKDPQKLIEELRKLIVDTTRRRNIPKSTGDYSNKEQDYLAKGVQALTDALNSWGDDLLASKLKEAFANITMGDIANIFKTAPSYWAISSGFYYAIADFDDFMQEIFTLIERNGVSLSNFEKETLKDRLFSNDPRTFK